jgi:hypothetical protein
MISTNFIKTMTMGVLGLVIMLGLTQPTEQVNITCYPCAVPANKQLFVTFEEAAYRYSLPTLSLQRSKTNYSHPLCCPGTFERRRLIFAAGQDNLNSTLLDPSSLAVVSELAGPAPPSPPRSWSQCANSSRYSICFVVENSMGYIERRRIIPRGNSPIQRIPLKNNDTVSNFIKFDAYVNNRLHLTTQSCFYRGCSNQSYYQISIEPFRVLQGPVELPQTGSFGCPVPPENCAVPVLLWFDVFNNVAVWTWSIAPSSETFQVTLQSYAVLSRTFSSAILGKSSSPL